MAGDARHLAAVLRATDDDGLRALCAARDVAADPGWHDLFDAADALLQPAAVRGALGKLSAQEARGLQRLVAGDGAPAEVTGMLRTLALVDDEGRAYDAVAEAVREAGAVAEPDGPARDLVDSPVAAERALTTVAAVADLLLATASHPVQLIANGSVSANERRRLIELELIGGDDEADPLFAIARDAGLVRTVGREWLVTSRSADWLSAATADRWRSLRAGFASTAPASVALGGVLSDPGTWRAAYPWAPDWPDHASGLLDRARLLGLVTADGAPTAWWQGDDAGVSQLVAHLPHEVDRVYLQNDLSAIAPGPLAPGLDLRLRSVADRESHAQASTYRFSAASVHRALARGETADTLREFLAALSLTGLPQPLDYLIGETARRYGELVVGTDPDTGRTRVTTTTDTLRETLQVDQSLRPLGLVADGPGLSTRVGRDTVAHALADARYPVAVVDEAGRPDPLQHGRIAPDDAEPVPPERYDDLVATLRSVSAADEEAAWLMRTLEEAVRQRAVLEVTVDLPDGVQRAFLLEAAGLGGGRLRGRDRAADIERTLPVSHISAIRVVEQPGR